MFKIYQIADFLDTTKKNIQFHINKLEGTPPAKNIIRPHKHQFYEVFLVKRGLIKQSVDYKEFEIKGTTLFFISQGQLHQWERNNEVFEGYRLMFTEEFLLLGQPNKNILFELIYLDNLYHNPYLELTEKNASQIIACFELLLEEFQLQDAREDALSSLVFVLLVKIQRLFNAYESNQSSKHQIVVYKQFIYLIEKHLTENLSPSDYAEKLSISPRHLNRIVQNVANQSVTDIIQQRTVLEAKRLLSYTNLTIGQITDQLGFEDTSYFSRYFRKITHCSPSDFRNQMTEKYLN
ncbi:HTH-type transcriptional activator RhaR [Emticicia aquatica]|uniref:HTH-type transcriptional activator RhaR n=1 Tax=Emticicia aquatica TaxID=1681835 RepID=A0ABN8EP68_9BACT|nr:helix-turn-helix domain-containing protein [Emticicia aquatica]CAH0994663.1 HTH-type transcriptional activator RhaR [Emticicia aquatica]